MTNVVVHGEPVNENQTRKLQWPPAWLSWRHWHWGREYPNSWRRGVHVHYHWRASVTVNEQRELHDAAWLILKRHGVVSDTTTYALATELADSITCMRDRQKEGTQ